MALFPEWQPRLRPRLCAAPMLHVGGPALVAPLHDAGCRVFTDVATIVHAEKALAAGVDGLVLLCAGAGGQTARLPDCAWCARCLMARSSSPEA